MLVSVLWVNAAFGAESLEAGLLDLRTIHDHHRHLKGAKTFPLKKDNIARDNFIEGLSHLLEGREALGLQRLKEATRFPLAHFVLGRYYEEGGDLKRMEKEYKRYLSMSRPQREREKALTGRGMALICYDYILDRFEEYSISYREISWEHKGFIIFFGLLALLGLMIALMIGLREDVMQWMRRRG